MHYSIGFKVSFFRCFNINIHNSWNKYSDIHYITLLNKKSWNNRNDFSIHTKRIYFTIYFMNCMGTCVFSNRLYHHHHHTATKCDWIEKWRKKILENRKKRISVDLDLDLEKFRMHLDHRRFNNEQTKTNQHSFSLWLSLLCLYLYRYNNYNGGEKKNEFFSNEQQRKIFTDCNLCLRHWNWIEAIIVTLNPVIILFTCAKKIN